MEQGCKLADNCIRTWFFVQNVDVNYAGVVKARNEVFITQNLTEKTHYISSTGIGGRHADPKVSVLMDTYAVDGIKSGQVHFLYAPAYLNPTYEYGVSFERGTYVTTATVAKSSFPVRQASTTRAKWCIQATSASRPNGCGKRGGPLERSGLYVR